MKTKLTISVFVLAIVMTLAGISKIKAQVIAKDYFNYGKVNLDGKGTNSDGWAGPWSKKAGTILISKDNVTVGKPSAVAQPDVKNAEYFRELDTLILDDVPKTIWVSYSGRQISLGTDWGGVSLFLYNAGVDTTELILFGTNWNTNNWGLANGPINIAPDAGKEKSCFTASRLVLQINMSGDAYPEDVYFYINPDSLKQPSTADAYISVLGKTAADPFDLSNGFNMIRLGAGNTIQYAFESLIIAGTYADLNLTTGINKISASDIGLTFYPNPMASSGKIEFKNSTNEKYTFSMFDITGKTVKTIENITTGQVNIERGNLESGLYFYKLQNSKGASVNGKIILQ